MKKQRLIEILILALVLVLLIAGILIFRHYKFEKPNTYNIVFQDIDSIVKGSPVRFMGINVGHVIKLRRKDKYIICKIRVTKEGVKIPNGTRAKVAFNGLGGSKSIELFPPQEDNSKSLGIVADESLRINDIATLAKDLEEVFIIINDFVQKIDPPAIMNGLKEITNPEAADKMNESLDEILNKQNKTHAEPSLFDGFIKQIDGFLKTFFGVKS